MTQGNYVNVGSIDANWGKGLSDSLADLSAMYGKQASEKKAIERQNLLDAENKRRFDLKESRAAAAERSRLEEEKRIQGVRDYYKNLSNLDYDAIRRAKAKEVYGITDEELAGEQGQEFLKVPTLFAEDIQNYVSRDLLTKHGAVADPNAVLPYLGDYQSLAQLQETENTSAKSNADLYKDRLDLQLKAAKALLDSDAKVKKGSAEYNSGYAALLTNPLAKSFSTNNDLLSWRLPWSDTEAEKAKVISDKYAQRLFEAGVPPATAKVVIQSALDSLTTGAKLDQINTDNDTVEAAYNTALSKVSANPYSQLESRAASVLNDLAADQYEKFNPRNMRQVFIDQNSRRLAALRGEVLPEPVQNTGSTAPQVNVEEVLRQRGLLPSDSDKSNKKSEAPLPTDKKEVLPAPQTPYVPKLAADGSLANEDTNEIPTTTTESAVAEAHLRKAFPKLSDEDVRRISFDVGYIGNLNNAQTTEVLGNIADNYGLDFAALSRAAYESQSGLQNQYKKQEARNKRLADSAFWDELLRLGQTALVATPPAAVAGHLPSVPVITRRSVDTATRIANSLRPLVQDIKFTREILPALRRFVANNSKVPIRETKVVGQNPFSTNTTQLVDDLLRPTVQRGVQSSRRGPYDPNRLNPVVSNVQQRLPGF